MSHRLAIVAALSASLFATAPAGAAAPAPLAAGGSFARTVPFIDGSIYQFECHASAPGATYTRVDTCVLTNGTSNLSSFDGTSSSQAAAAEGWYSEPSYNWKLCWAASATYGDGSTKSTSGCTATSQIAAAGHSETL